MHLANLDLKLALRFELVPKFIDCTARTRHHRMFFNSNKKLCVAASHESFFIQWFTKRIFTTRTPTECLFANFLLLQLMLNTTTKSQEY
jgi:hypothetical protein